MAERCSRRLSVYLHLVEAARGGVDILASVVIARDKAHSQMVDLASALSRTERRDEMAETLFRHMQRSCPQFQAAIMSDVDVNNLARAFELAAMTWVEMSRVPNQETRP